MHSTTKIEVHSPAFYAIKERIPSMVEEWIRQMDEYHAEQNGYTFGSPEQLMFHKAEREYNDAGDLVSESVSTVDADTVYMDIKYRAKRYKYTVKIQDDPIVITAKKYFSSYLYGNRTVVFEYTPVVD